MRVAAQSRYIEGFLPGYESAKVLNPARRTGDSTGVPCPHGPGMDWPSGILFEPSM